MSAARRAAFEGAGPIVQPDGDQRHPRAALLVAVAMIGLAAKPAPVESVNRAERARRQASRALLTRVCELARAAGARLSAGAPRAHEEGLPGQLGADVRGTLGFGVRGGVRSPVPARGGLVGAASTPRRLKRTESQYGHLADGRALAAGTGGTGAVIRCPKPPQGGRAAVTR